MTAFRLILALIFASALSQFPAFSDQYVQRLGGQVDALTRVAAEFDASAERAGMTREQALADLSGSNFRDVHQGDMRRTFARLEHAQADLDLLRKATPIERIALPQRFRDTETLRATWDDYTPAMPISTSGVVTAAIGFVMGWIIATLLGMPFRRRQRLGWR